MFFFYITYLLLTNTNNHNNHIAPLHLISKEMVEMDLFKLVCIIRYKSALNGIYISIKQLKHLIYGLVINVEAK